MLSSCVKLKRLDFSPLRVLILRQCFSVSNKYGQYPYF
nr:MAG TPA: hypothetical protein [Caudoviricetes sp.]